MQATPPRANSRTSASPLSNRRVSGRAPATYTIVDVSGAGTEADQGTYLETVNSSMVSSGSYVDSSNNTHGFVRASDGTITTFDVDGPLSQTTSAWMNDNSVVVGHYIDQGTGAQNGFARASDGAIITIAAGATSIRAKRRSARTRSVTRARRGRAVGVGATTAPVLIAAPRRRGTA